VAVDAGAPGDPLRVIHVGVGGRGRSHVHASLQSGYWRPVALVDVSQRALAAARDATGLPSSACFATLDDALARVESDAVVVATPVALHAGQITSALRAGRHVLTEKCFTVGLADAERCVALAAERGRKIMVVQDARLNRPARTLRRLVAEETYGALGMFQLTFYKVRGEPYHPSAHMHLWQQGVHELDTLLAVVQRPVRRVWGLSNNPAWCDWPSESTVQAIIECEGGVSGTYVSTSNARGWGYELRLECADAAIVAHDRSASDLEIRRGKDLKGRVAGPEQEWVPLDTPDLRGLEHVGDLRDTFAIDAVTSPSEAQAGRLRDLQLYRNFYEYITSGREPESSGPRNLETMRLLDAIQRSTELGQPVTL
jgi:predicted dehydrogenase